MCRTLGRRHETRRLSWVSEEQLGRKNLSNATAAANMNETTKKVRRVLDINACQEDLNVKEATACWGTVEDEHHARDANISMLYLIKDHDCNI